MQKLLEEIAFKIRDFYSTHSIKSKNTSKDIIASIMQNLDSKLDIVYEEVSNFDTLQLGDCLLIHSIQLDKPIIFGTLFRKGTDILRIAGRTYDSTADPQIFEIPLAKYNTDWLMYKLYIPETGYLRRAKNETF